MSNVFDELRHNIKNSVFINVILIIQFILFFWQSTMILSYFLDMPLDEIQEIYRVIRHTIVWDIPFQMMKERQLLSMRAVIRTIFQIRRKYTVNCTQIRICIL